MRVFSTFLECSEMSGVRYHSVIYGLGFFICFMHSFSPLLTMLYDIEVLWRKTIKHAFSMFYTLVEHGFLTNQSACKVRSMV